MMVHSVMRPASAASHVCLHDNPVAGLAGLQQFKRLIQLQQQQQQQQGQL
jgi:hypothetical protein